VTKEKLISEIQTAFQNVQLEDGIGIWEGQGIDDYADEKTILELRKKDERNNWDSIPYQHLNACASSLSFFDAKGMRFCLPKFLIFDLLQEQIQQEQGIASPDVLFTLGYKLDEAYQKNRFSLFSSIQIQCIISYLEYKLEEFITTYKKYSTNDDTVSETFYSDSEYVELTRILNEWKEKSHVL
jgi:hypothetical protein